MATLRTNYKDDVFSGNRKYNMINNGDGSYSFVDVTQYTQQGDSYGANDINTLNQTVNDLSQGSGGLVVSNVPIPIADRNPGSLYFFRS